MNKPIKAITCATALTVALSPLANAAFEYPKVTVSHIAKPITAKQEPIARCVNAIQKMWNREAKLVLDLRGRLRDTEYEQVLLVNGWVWEQGQRVKKHHQCTTNKATQQFALRVEAAEQPLVAGR